MRPKEVSLRLIRDGYGENQEDTIIRWECRVLKSAWIWHSHAFSSLPHMRRSDTQATEALKTLLIAIGDTNRWRIFAEMFGEEAMPLTEIARRAGLPVTNTSKHLAVLVGAGILERAYGKLYRLRSRWVVPGERALDFGRVRIRLDEK
jgi:DNA-binding transcriptional ArsR family regulator